MPGDGGNDVDTSVPVGTGAVTGNVIELVKVVVDHTIDDADYDGTTNVSKYPNASQSFFSLSVGGGV